MVWDNLGAHRKAENFFHAIDWPWARFHRLPPYAPELNPVEHVWSTSKWGPLAGALPEDLGRLNTRLNEELTRQATTQQILSGHFRWAGLDLR
ncbi:MAG: transposase [Botrimarina sp.]